MFLRILRVTWRLCVQRVHIMFDLLDISIDVVGCFFLRLTQKFIVIDLSV